MIRLLRLPAARRRLLLEAAGELARAAWLVRMRPFSHYRNDLGRPLGPEIRPDPSGRLDEARAVRSALLRINQAVGGRFTCLMLAMAGKRMLTRRGIPNALVLGARRAASTKTPERNLTAHAWLQINEGVLLGSSAMTVHTPIVIYLTGR